jgi:hypothetical protein
MRQDSLSEVGPLSQARTPVDTRWTVEEAFQTGKGLCGPS